MNKRELVNWLENKKQEVLRANDAYYEETIKKEQERLLQERKFYEMAQKVQQCLNQAVQIWSDWKRANDDNNNMRIDLGYCDVTRSLYSLTRSEDEVAKRLQWGAIDFCSEYIMQLKQEQGITAEKINDSYKKVITAVSYSRSSKEAMELVANLGFNLAEMEDQLSPTSTSLQIDPVYLFPAKNETEKQAAA